MIESGDQVLIEDLQSSLSDRGSIDAVNTVVRKAVQGRIVALARIPSRTPGQEEEIDLLSILDWSLYHWSRGSFKSKVIREIVVEGGAE